MAFNPTEQYSEYLADYVKTNEKIQSNWAAHLEQERLGGLKVPDVFTFTSAGAPDSHDSYNKRFALYIIENYPEAHEEAALRYPAHVRELQAAIERRKKIALSGQVRVLRVLKQSKARYAQGIDVGDTITVRINLVRTAGSRGLYALQADLYKNDELTPYVHTSQNELMKLFNIFELEDLGEDL